jgi:hypothetical protein
VTLSQGRIAADVVRIRACQEQAWSNRDRLFAKDAMQADAFIAANSPLVIAVTYNETLAQRTWQPVGLATRQWFPWRRRLFPI